jgi:hypothetical protein
MARLAAALIVIGLILGLFWLNDATATRDNITCVRQTGVAGAVRYELCIAGQQPQYVPYSVWRRARVGGYYDEGARATYGSADDDPRVSHGVFGGGSDDEGHTSHVSSHVSDDG